MRKLLSIVLAAAFMIPVAATAWPGGNTGYVKTSGKYSEHDNYNRICRREFGRHARVADFRDIQKLYRKSRKKHRRMRNFTEDTGLNRSRQSALLEFQGRKTGKRGRAYYIEMRDHKRSRDRERVVRDIGDHLFELKVRRKNHKPVLCYIPKKYRGPQVKPLHGHVTTGRHGVDIARKAAERAEKKHSEPRLLSTSRTYREYHYLNKKCQKEFGRKARVADWRDVEKMLRTRRDLKRFLDDNHITRGNRDRLLYYRGKYKNHRDRHYYMIFNKTRKTPRGVHPVDRAHRNQLNLATRMHVRAPVLCWVP